MSPTLASFLSYLKLEHLFDVLESEQITLEILAEMGHDDLKQVWLKKNKLKSVEEIITILNLLLGWN